MILPNFEVEVTSLFPVKCQSWALIVRESNRKKLTAKAVDKERRLFFMTNKFKDEIKIKERS